VTREGAPGNRGKDTAKFYGIQACLGIFKHRRQDIQRVFVDPQVRSRFLEVERWCAKQRIPFKAVEVDELSRVAGTDHHEGVCFEAMRHRGDSFEAVLKKLSKLPSRCILVLEGVENPHNVGAIIRTACFFGVDAIVLISVQSVALSGAACRVAEGGAEVVPVVIANNVNVVVSTLRAEGFELVATTPHQASSVYSKTWPANVALLFGSEGSGLSPELLKAAHERVVIPRVGALESLNVGAAVASILTELRRQSSRLRN
jgi:TrmH RNA methyltransferase